MRRPVRENPFPRGPVVPHGKEFQSGHAHRRVRERLPPLQETEERPVAELGIVVRQALGGRAQKRGRLSPAPADLERGFQQGTAIPPPPVSGQRGRRVDILDRQAPPRRRIPLRQQQQHGNGKAVRRGHEAFRFQGKAAEDRPDGFHRVPWKTGEPEPGQGRPVFRTGKARHEIIHS